MMLLIAKILNCRMMGYLVNKVSETIEKKQLCPDFLLLFCHLPGGIEESHMNPQ
jgi:hypothetical protein